jgi:hypothetical protein
MRLLNQGKRKQEEKPKVHNEHWKRQGDTLTERGRHFTCLPLYGTLILPTNEAQF